MNTWDPFRPQPTPDADVEAAEHQAGVQRRARDERIDQQIRSAVTKALAEPTMSDQIRNAAGRRGRHADRLFGPAETDDGPPAA